jgi:hypothetical protein
MKLLDFLRTNVHECPTGAGYELSLGPEKTGELWNLLRDAEAEVERLRAQRNKAIDIADARCCGCNEYARSISEMCSDCNALEEMKEAAAKEGQA